jgi:hypothetical protein
MLKRPAISTVFATIYLLLYILLLNTEDAPDISFILFFFSPIVLIALAYSIIRYGKYGERELADHEHWGYQDRPEKNQDQS